VYVWNCSLSVDILSLLKVVRYVAKFEVVLYMTNMSDKSIINTSVPSFLLCIINYSRVAMSFVCLELIPLCRYFEFPKDS
jgi:hypothetical protein